MWRSMTQHINKGTMVEAPEPVHFSILRSLHQQIQWTLGILILQRLIPLHFNLWLTILQPQQPLNPLHIVKRLHHPQMQNQVQG